MKIYNHLAGILLIEVINTTECHTRRMKSGSFLNSTFGCYTVSIFIESLIALRRPFQNTGPKRNYPVIQQCIHLKISTFTVLDKLIMTSFIKLLDFIRPFHHFL